MKCKIYYLDMPNEETSDPASFREKDNIISKLMVMNEWDLIPKAIETKIYKYIGEIIVSSPQRAYENLQNDFYKDGHPLENRSMMVGDIVVSEFGEGFVCASIGYEKLETDVVAALEAL